MSHSVRPLVCVLPAMALMGGGTILQRQSSPLGPVDSSQRSSALSVGRANLTEEISACRLSPPPAAALAPRRPPPSPRRRLPRLAAGRRRRHHRRRRALGAARRRGVAFPPDRLRAQPRAERRSCPLLRPRPRLRGLRRP